MNYLVNNFIGDRDYNEDRYFFKKIANNLEISGIFDGHGGSGVSDFCCKYIYKKLKLFMENLNLKYQTYKECTLENDKLYSDIKELEYKLKKPKKQLDYIIKDVINDIIDDVVDENNTTENTYTNTNTNTNNLIRNEILKINNNIKKNQKIINSLHDDIINQDKIIENFLIELFHNTQYKLITYYKDFNAEEAGSTAIVCILFNDNLYVANCGDCRCVLVDYNLDSYQVTEDHNVHNLQEKSRILIENNGHFEKNYLYGRINVTRSLGDLWQFNKMYSVNNKKIPSVDKWSNLGLKNYNDYKKFTEKVDLNWILKPTPEIYKIENVKSRFFSYIIASDGIWQATKNRCINELFFNAYIEMCEELNGNNNDNNNDNNSNLINKKILENVLKLYEKRNKSVDNITYIFRLLNEGTIV